MEDKTKNEMPRQEAAPEDPPGPSLIKKVNVLKSPIARVMFGAVGITALIGTVLVVASRTVGDPVERVAQVAKEIPGYLKVVEVRAGDAGRPMADPPPVPFDIKDDARKSDKKSAQAGASALPPPPPPAPSPGVAEASPGTEKPAAGAKLAEKETDTPPGGGAATAERAAAPGDGTEKPKTAGKEPPPAVPGMGLVPKKKAPEKDPPGGSVGRYGKPVVPAKAKASVRIVFKGDAATVNALAANRLLTVGVLVNGANAARYFPIPEDISQSFDGPVTDACYALLGYGEKDGVNTIVKLSDTLMSRITLALKDAGKSGNAAIEISPDGSVRSLLKRL